MEIEKEILKLIVNSPVSLFGKPAKLGACPGKTTKTFVNSREK
jgi:hypothetical protein